MSPIHSRWSDEDVARLTELWLAEVSIKAMARTLQRTERAVVAKADRLRDDLGVNLPLRNGAGATAGWMQRRGLARRAS